MTNTQTDKIANESLKLQIVLYKDANLLADGIQMNLEEKSWDQASFDYLQTTMEKLQNMEDEKKFIQELADKQIDAESELGQTVLEIRGLIESLLPKIDSIQSSLEKSIEKLRPQISENLRQKQMMKAYGQG